MDTNFTLDAHGAALAADVTTNDLYDAVRTFDVSFAVIRVGTGFAPSQLRFDPVDVADMRDRRERDRRTADELNRSVTQRVMRDYFQERPAVGDADIALAQGRPLNAALRSGREDTYVTAKAIMEFARERGKLVTTTAIDATFERMGTIRRRGVVPLADRGTSKQRWNSWWRVPESLLPGGTTNEAVLISGIAEGLAGSPGERVTTRSGKPHLAEPIGDVD